jgi:pimeloyl-ACP methyl ester carboxylesterase
VYAFGGRVVGWVLTLLVVGAVGVALLFALPASTAAIRDATGAVVPTSIASVEPILLNGVRQWLVIRGRDRTNPVLLYLHGGPGTPETALLIHYNRALEKDFVVVSWEQRGAGKSYPAGRTNPEAVTAEQLLADTRALTGYLKDRFGQDRLYLVGHSWATLLGIRAASRHPKDYHALVSVAQTSDAVHEAAAMHTWVLDQARQNGKKNRRAIRALTALAPPTAGRLPLRDRKVRVKWVNHYGGGVMRQRGAIRRLARVMVCSREYTTWEKLRYLRGQAFTLRRLFPDGNLTMIDLRSEIPAVDVPVYFVHGRHDHLVDMRVARDYADALRAPHKKFVVFDNSAHSPLFEEPDRFRRLMREVLDQTATPGRC